MTCGVDEVEAYGTRWLAVSTEAVYRVGWINSPPLVTLMMSGDGLLHFQSGICYSGQVVEPETKSGRKRKRKTQ